MSNLFQVYPLLPITIEKALGSKVWDDQGQEYLDMYGGHAVISIGHSHPHYVQRIQDQLSKIGFYSNSVQIPIQEALAEKLIQLSGKKDYRLFLVNSGAEANENALKLASFHTGRKTILTFTGAFHGRTSLAVAVTDNPKIQAPVNQTDHVLQLPFNDVNALEDCFAKQGNSIAAVIVEGIQGVGGIHEASADFLRAIRQLCTAYGAVYIADSVQCGYGRSGQFFSHDLAGVNADIYSMAKGMGNGFPIGGILIAPHIQAVPGMLGTTFGGNHLACAAALAVLEVMESEKLLEHTQATGQLLMNALRNIPGVKTVRGRGLMLGVVPEDKDWPLKKMLLEKSRVFTGEAKDAVRLLPALNLAPSDAEYFVEQVKVQLHQLQNNFLNTSKI
jgi:acetylornithine aminotransferase